MNNKRIKRAQLLFDECNEIFSESIEKQYTFYDANVADHWGQEPPPNEIFEEPWTCWKDIPDEILNENSYIFSFFEFDESLFYVAAFMRLTLKDVILPNYDLKYDFTGGTLAFVGKHFDDLNTFKLNEQQRMFIHKFVSFFLEDKDLASWLNIHRKSKITNVLA